MPGQVAALDVGDHGVNPGEVVAHLVAAALILPHPRREVGSARMQGHR